MRENLFWSLTMEEAFVYFEDVKDMGTGAIRNLQTTKKKFRDATGRLCVLGMCVDVTTTTKVKVEEAETQTRKQEEKKQQALEKHYQKDMERLSYIANHDKLTGVYDRAMYEAKRNGKQGYQFFADLR